MADKELIPTILETYKTAQAWAKARYGDDAEPRYDKPGWYAAGGYIPGTSAPIRLHPDECLISAKDALVGNIVCSRPGHPTPTSDCHPRKGEA